MIFNFFRKIKIFFKKEDRKVFSLFIIIFKTILALLIMSLLPVVFFIVFIIKEPREIISINNYINQKIQQLKIINNLNYKTAKISLNKHLNIVYNISDLEVNINNINLMCKEAVFKIKLLDLLRNKVFFNKIEVDHFNIDFNYEEKQDINNINSSVSYEKIESNIINLLDYFNNKTLIFEDFIIKNSNFYLLSKDIKKVDEIILDELKIKLEKNRKNNLNLFTELKLLNNNQIINSKNICIISKDKQVDCDIDLDNLFILDIIKIFTKDTSLEKYSKNIEGIFNINIKTSFKNYIEPIKSNFIIKSKNGNFLLKDFFPKTIYYNNLIINGSSKDNNQLILNSITAKLNTNKNNKNNLDFLMSLNVKNKEFMKLNFDLANVKVEELNNFWPLFLDDLGIREWVIEHFKSGIINKAYAYMDFSYNNNNFILDKIDSEVYCNNTLLNYDKNFPAVKNLSAKLVFTINDMNIFINNGNIENTKILNGKVYTDFNNPSINITGQTIGDAYEMFYFVSNDNKENTKKIITNYINGIANSNIKVDIPLNKNDITLDSVFVNIKSKIDNNNTFIFKDNSQLELLINKNYNSNNFATKINLNKSYLNFDIIDFIKEKDKKLSTSLDIIVEDSNKILLKNIISNNDILKLNGEGLITNTILKKLNINAQYKNNNFNINYFDTEENNKIQLDIIGNKINLNITNKIDDNKIDINGIKSNFNINCFFDNVFINNNYKFNNLKTNISYFNERIDKITLYDINDKNTYNFNIDINNNIDDKTTYDIKAKFNNIGKILSDADITNNILYGDVYVNGKINKNMDIYAEIKIKNKIAIITKEIKNAKFFNYILNSDLISDKTKNKLSNENSLSFDNMSAKLQYYNNILKINNLLLKSDNIFSIGISGKGKIYLDSGKIDFNGLVIPADKINTLFGINKIPVINKILFGGKDGGLFTVGYTFNKEDYNSKYEFKLLPIGSSSINSIKNVFLLLMFI